MSGKDSRIAMDVGHCLLLEHADEELYVVDYGRDLDHTHNCVGQPVRHDCLYEDFDGLLLLSGTDYFRLLARTQPLEDVRRDKLLQGSRRQVRTPSPLDYIPYLDDDLRVWEGLHVQVTQ